MEDRPLTTGEALQYTHGLRLYRGEPIRSIHYHRARQALSRVADRVGPGLGSGRPWLWALKPEFRDWRLRDTAKTDWL
jgi:hypothetical protein